MNNYIDYYNYLNNLNQNAMNTSNKMPKVGSNQSVNMNNLGYDTDPYTGFMKGNMFSNLYEPYKNYQIQEINPTNEREYALLMIQMYGFAAHDLGLYLDVNPNDTNAINLRSEYVKLYKQALAEYESKYGALGLSSNMLDVTPWAWDSKKWPWEGNR